MSSDCLADLPTRLLFSLAPGFPFPACVSTRVPTVLLYRGTGLQPLLSIGYVFDLALARLTQSRSAFYSETLDIRPEGFSPSSQAIIPAFSLLYSPQPLSVLLLPAYTMLLYQCTSTFLSFGSVFQPRHSATSRLVSYYALLLNVWLLLSQHPSCLRNPTSFFHLTHILGPSCRFVLPFWLPNLFVQSDSHTPSTHSSLIFFGVFDAPLGNSVLYLRKTCSAG